MFRSKHWEWSIRWIGIRSYSPNGYIRELYEIQLEGVPT